MSETVNTDEVTKHALKVIAQKTSKLKPVKSVAQKSVTKIKSQKMATKTREDVQMSSLAFSDSEDEMLLEENASDKNNHKQKRLVYDRLDRSDENGMKTQLLFDVFSNKYHLNNGNKIANFHDLARKWEVLKIQDQSTISGDALRKKYDALMKTIVANRDAGMIGLEDKVDGSKFDGTEAFEKLGLHILKDIDDADALKAIAAQDKISKNNSLSAKEESALAIATSSTSTRKPAKVKSTTTASSSKAYVDKEMEQFQAILSSLIPTPATPVNESGLVDCVLVKLQEKSITTVGEALEAADLSADGIVKIYEHTGFTEGKAVKKLVVAYLHCRGNKTAPLLDTIRSEFGLRMCDAQDLIEYMNSLIND